PEVRPRFGARNLRAHAPRLAPVDGAEGGSSFAVIARAGKAEWHSAVVYSRRRHRSPQHHRRHRVVGIQPQLGWTVAAGYGTAGGGGARGKSAMAAALTAGVSGHGVFHPAAGGS